jgi:phosphoglycerate kinase
MKSGTRVLMRVETNVPLVRGRVQDGKHGRLAQTAPELARYAERGAKLIVLSHLGRPDGRRVRALSNAPVARAMEKMLHRRVLFSKDLTGPKVKKTIAKMRAGDILWLENVRFDPREEQDSQAFAKELAALADVYVNNAFGVCHRAHASVHAIARELPSYAGTLVQQEVRELGRPFQKPFVLVMGGMKLKTKLPALGRLAPQADRILIGGARERGTRKIASYGRLHDSSRGITRRACRFETFRRQNTAPDRRAHTPREACAQNRGTLY